MTGVLVAANEAEAPRPCPSTDRRCSVTTLQAPSSGSTNAARAVCILGTPDQALERIAAFEANGTQRLMLQDFIPRDLDMIRFIGAENCRVARRVTRLAPAGRWRSRRRRRRPRNSLLGGHVLALQGLDALQDCDCR